MPTPSTDVIIKKYIRRYLSGQATPFHQSSDIARKLEQKTEKIKNDAGKIMTITTEKYSRDELLKKTNPDLKNICESLKIKKNGNKDELIARILERNGKTTSDTIAKLQGKTTKTQVKHRDSGCIIEDIDSLSQVRVENMTIEKLKMIAKQKSIPIRGLSGKREICSAVVKALFNSKLAPVIPKPEKGYTADFIGEKLSKEIAKAIHESNDDETSEAQPVFSLVNPPKGWTKSAAYGKKFLFNNDQNLVGIIQDGKMKILASSRDNGRTFRALKESQKEWCKKRGFDVAEPSTPQEKDDRVSSYEKAPVDDSDDEYFDSLLGEDEWDVDPVKKSIQSHVSSVKRFKKLFGIKLNTENKKQKVCFSLYLKRNKPVVSYEYDGKSIRVKELKGELAKRVAKYINKIHRNMDDGDDNN